MTLSLGTAATLVLALASAHGASAVRGDASRALPDRAESLVRVLVARGHLTAGIAADLERRATVSAGVESDAARQARHDLLVEYVEVLDLELGDPELAAAPAGAQRALLGVADVTVRGLSAESGELPPVVHSLSRHCRRMADALAQGSRAAGDAELARHQLEWRLRETFPIERGDAPTLEQSAAVLRRCAEILASPAGQRGFPGEEATAAAARLRAHAEELLGQEFWTAPEAADDAGAQAVLSDLLAAHPGPDGIRALFERLDAGLASLEPAEGQPAAPRERVLGRHLEVRALAALCAERRPDPALYGPLCSALPGLVEIAVTVDPPGAWPGHVERLTDAADVTTFDPGPATAAHVWILGGPGAGLELRPAPLDPAPGRWRLLPGLDYLFEIAAHDGDVVRVVLHGDPDGVDLHLPPVVPTDHTILLDPGGDEATADLVALSNAPQTRAQLARRISERAEREYIWEPDPERFTEAEIAELNDEQIYRFLVAFLADVPAVGQLELDLRKLEDREQAIALLATSGPPEAHVASGEEAAHIHAFLRQERPPRLPRAHICDWVEPWAESLGWTHVAGGVRNLGLEAEVDLERNYVIRDFVRISPL